jgi:hypothetical protein
MLNIKPFFSKRATLNFNLVYYQQKTKKLQQMTKTINLIWFCGKKLNLIRMKILLISEIRFDFYLIRWKKNDLKILIWLSGWLKIRMDEIYYCGFNGFKQVPSQPEKHTVTSLVLQTSPKSSNTGRKIIDVAICWVRIIFGLFC